MFPMSSGSRCTNLCSMLFPVKIPLHRVLLCFKMVFSFSKVYKFVKLFPFFSSSTLVSLKKSVIPLGFDRSCFINFWCLIFILSCKSYSVDLHDIYCLRNTKILNIALFLNVTEHLIYLTIHLLVLK